MSELDFRSLRYDFSKVRGDLLEAFPDLAKIEGIEKIEKQYNGIDRNSILKYLILMYDPGSPISEPDLMPRKSMCALEAGFPRERGGRFIKPAEQIIMLDDKLFANIVVSFVSSFHSATYSKLVAYRQHYESLLRLLMTKGGKDVKLGDIDILEDSINDMQARLLRDNSPKLVEALYEKVISDQLKLRPEDIAEKIENGEDPIDVRPYGDEYNPKKKYAWKGHRLESDTN